jgi:hypothetical protein
VALPAWLGVTSVAFELITGVGWTAMLAWATCPFVAEFTEGPQALSPSVNRTAADRIVAPCMRRCLSEIMQQEARRAWAVPTAKLGADA